MLIFHECCLLTQNIYPNPGYLPEIQPLPKPSADGKTGRKIIFHHRDVKIGRTKCLHKREEARYLGLDNESSWWGASCL